MTAKELLERAPTWSEEQAERALLAVDAELPSTVDDEWGEPETVGLPESWKTFDDGTPQPDWLATLDEVRRGH
jgi:hypothetical protein